MTLEEKLVAAVVPIVPICRPHYYRRSSDEKMPEEFCSYSFDRLPTLFSSGRPGKLRKSFLLNYCCPINVNPAEKIIALANAIVDAGFTYPTVTDASDEDYGNYAFEFEGIEHGTV